MKMTLANKVERRRKASITAWNRRGELITDMNEIAFLALTKSSVVCEYWGLLPAVCIMNMQAGIVLSEIHRKRIFRYNKPITNSKKICQTN